MATIHLLPNELLTAIFKAGSLTNPGPHELSFPLLVSSICRHWRDIAINAPDLWTNIDASWFRPRTLLFLERSKSSLLYISLNIYRFSPSYTSLNEAVHTFASHIHRIRRLAILAELVEDVQGILKPFYHLPAPNLEYMQILVLTPNPWPIPLLHFPLLTGAIKLRSLKLAGLCFQWTSPFEALTDLDIKGFQPSYDEFRGLFIASPSLTRLVLREFATFSSDSESNGHDLPVIETVSLRYLAISFDFSHCFDQCQCPLSSLAMPNLEYLEVVQRDAIPNSLVEHFSIKPTKTQYQKLHTLRLEGLAICDMDATFFRAFTMITHLELINVRSIHSLQDLAAKDGSTAASCCGPIAWPHLRSITLDTPLSYDDWSWLYDIVTSQIEAGCRLFTVQIRPTSWEISGTRGQDVVNQLQKLSAVEFVDLDDVMGFIEFDYDSDGTEEDSADGELSDRYHDFDGWYTSDFDNEEEYEEEDDGLEGVLL